MKNSESKNIDNLRLIFESYLKTHSLRKTPERFAILEAINSTNGIFTNEQMYNKLIFDMKFHISRQTIYNTLDIIEKAHIIKRKVGKWEGDARLVHYEKCIFQNANHGFICRKCGNIIDFNTGAIDTFVKNLKKKGMIPKTYTFFVYGTCPRCTEQKNKI